MQKTTKLIIVNILLVVIICALVSQQVGMLLSKNSSGSSDSLRNSDNAFLNNNSVLNLNATSISFNSSELTLWLSVVNRLSVINSDPVFTGDRTLQWISMRNSSSSDYYQKSMEFVCFWSGQGANGEWEAVISIYNFPNLKADFVVEVSRFTWHSLEVALDGSLIASFPQVTNDTISLGYATFHVTA
jgi:hypothetical protein